MEYKVKFVEFKTLVIIFFVVILCLMESLNAQEKQKIPVEFFTGRWAGSISGYARLDDCPRPPRIINFTIDWISGGLSGGEAIIKPYRVIGVGHLMFLGNIVPNAPIIENGKAYLISPFFASFAFSFSETELVPVTDQFVLALWFLSLIDPGKSNNIIDINNNIIFINHRQEEGCPKCGVGDALFFGGEIHRLDIKKLVFPKDIKPNEPIKTDKRTQLEITMPSKDVIKIAQNTEAVIKSENLIEVMKGRIHSMIKQVKPKTKFEVSTPASVTGIRGTDYEIEVLEDGTTTVIVFDGEVEFSDIDNRKTVIVKENQISVCKPNDLPSAPTGIEQGHILKWWE